MMVQAWYKMDFGTGTVTFMENRKAFLRRH